MNENNNEKSAYCTPQIERIRFDNEISLALESLPPSNAPGESYQKAPDYFNNDPLRNPIV